MVVILKTSQIGATGIVVAGLSPEEEFNSCYQQSSEIKGQNKDKQFADSSI